ncbi:hypothetical protein [Oricola cellulosilytica]|uniref:Glycosyltransferase family 4 protein n=1 Tax=Oricola cellulosilytica TaxID=1429082 RepID=A0A4R0P9V7_9HYPH|nr:hypothetical protein [Oricola cellulosilytica]TCD14050.1 hypothetical protein E0D97_08115 [Oricola cellulosilytica]
MLTILPPVIAALASLLLCLAVRSGKLAFFPVAQVNARSLHDVPVRTSAGLAIIAATIAAWFVSVLLGGEADLFAVMTGAAVMALTGLADDIKGLSARFRLAVQILVIAALLASAYRYQTWLPWAALPVILVAILWFVNLFNFIDGSDGLAASQTIFGVFPLVAAGAAGHVEAGAEVGTTLVALMFAAAAFLIFNWPRASLFMGDSGSLAIPVLLAGTALFSPDPAMSGLLLAVGFAPSVADATLTLAIRFLAGERWWAAHRTHAYQLAARKTGTHLTPLVAFWLAGLLWLAPLGWLAATGALSPFAALAGAYLPAIAVSAIVQWKLRRAIAA